MKYWYALKLILVAIYMYVIKSKQKTSGAFKGRVNYFINCLAINQQGLFSQPFSKNGSTFRVTKVEKLTLKSKVKLPKNQKYRRIQTTN